MDLYKFSVNSWHVKVFMFIYGFNPVHYYKTMCPYFWKSLLGYIFFPIILFIRVVNWFFEYCKEIRDRIDRAKKLKKAREIVPLFDSIKEWNAENVDMFLLKYNLYKVSTDVYHMAIDLRYGKNSLGNSSKSVLLWESKNNLIWEDVKAANYEKFRKAKIVEEKRLKRYLKLKSSKIYRLLPKLLSILVITIIVGIISAAVYGIYYWITFHYSNFISWMRAILGIILAFSFGALIGLIIMIIFNFIGNRVSSISKILYKIGNIIVYPFKLFFRGVTMLIDMIKNLYKEMCPIITWVEEE